jgi:hypothetical protein
MHFSHYYFKIHNGTATVEEICVSEHGQRGPNSCRPHARDGISRTGQCRAGVDGGQGRRSDVSRSDATTSSCNRPPANRRDRVGSTPRPRLRKNGSSKTAGTPVRDRSRHGGRRANWLGRQHCWTPSGWHPARAACLRHSVHYAGQLASLSLAARRFNPKKATGASPIPPSPTTPSTTASCRPTSRCAPSGHHGSRSPPAWKNKELLQFLLTGWSLSLAPTNVLLGNPAALKRAFESGGASLVLGLRSYLR